MSVFLSIFRLCLATVFLGMSLMVVIQARKIDLWFLVILVTEYGQWLLLFPLGLLIWELLMRSRNTGLLTILFCIVAIGLFLKPMIQAAWIAHSLPAKLTASLGAEEWPNHRPPNLPLAPLIFSQLWCGKTIPSVKEQSFKFSTQDGSQLKLLTYCDATPGLRPCILMIHGGGWNSGNEKELQVWNRLLAGAGYRVATMSYRLAPAFHWPAPKEDVVAALAFLKSHAIELGIDSDQFVLLGRSAGGQIALATAYAVHDPAIRGCIASYAPTDMGFAYQYSKEDDILHSRSLVRSYMGGLPVSEPALYHDASALDLIGSATPPTLLIHGTRDELVWVRHSYRLRESLKNQGKTVFFLELPWATHAFDFNPAGPGGQLEYYAMVWFLDSIFKGKTK